ncbi:MAG: ketosteroid isomerase family protein [Coleofasciculaceae cyanobacterium]
MTIAQESTSTVPDTNQELVIEGISESVILDYFATMNSGDFEATAALFAETGTMQPPFAEPVMGQEAIANYLKTEAQGMQLAPRQGQSEILEEEIQIQVSGKVQTSVFGVNVSWIFILNPQQEILFTKIKLLASPQELLNLRR